MGRKKGTLEAAVTGYEFPVYDHLFASEDDVNTRREASTLTVSVKRRGPDKWCVVDTLNQVYRADGTCTKEGLSSNRTADQTEQTRFDLDMALQVMCLVLQKCYGEKLDFNRASIDLAKRKNSETLGGHGSYELMYGYLERVASIWKAGVEETLELVAQRESSEGAIPPILGAIRCGMQLKAALTQAEISQIAGVKKSSVYHCLVANKGLLKFDRTGRVIGERGEELAKETHLNAFESGKFFKVNRYEMTSDGRALFVGDGAKFAHLFRKVSTSSGPLEVIPDTPENRAALLAAGMVEEKDYAVSVDLIRDRWTEAS